MASLLLFPLFRIAVCAYHAVVSGSSCIYADIEPKEWAQHVPLANLLFVQCRFVSAFQSAER